VIQPALLRCGAPPPTQPAPSHPWLEAHIPSHLYSGYLLTNLTSHPITPSIHPLTNPTSPPPPPPNHPAGGRRQHPHRHLGSGARARRAGPRPGALPAGWSAGRARALMGWSAGCARGWVGRARCAAKPATSHSDSQRPTAAASLSSDPPTHLLCRDGLVAWVVGLGWGFGGARRSMCLQRSRGASRRATGRRSFLFAISKLHAAGGRASACGHRFQRPPSPTRPAPRPLNPPPQHDTRSSTTTSPTTSKTTCTGWGAPGARVSDPALFSLDY